MRLGQEIGEQSGKGEMNRKKQREREKREKHVGNMFQDSGRELSLLTS